VKNLNLKTISLEEKKSSTFHGESVGITLYILATSFFRFHSLLFHILMSELIHFFHIKPAVAHSFSFYYSLFLFTFCGWD
jgi:hypothetical protein